MKNFRTQILQRVWSCVNWGQNRPSNFSNSTAKQQQIAEKYWSLSSSQELKRGGPLSFGNVIWKACISNGWFVLFPKHMYIEVNNAFIPFFIHAECGKKILIDETWNLSRALAPLLCQVAQAPSCHRFAVTLYLEADMRCPHWGGRRTATRAHGPRTEPQLKSTESPTVPRYVKKTSVSFFRSTQIIWITL